MIAEIIFERTANGKDQTIISPALYYDKSVWSGEVEYSVGIILFFFVVGIQITIKKK